MAQEKKFTHRLRDDLIKGIEQGYNSFFYYGVGTNDVFLYNYYYGILSIEDNFKHIFLDTVIDETNRDNSLANSYIYFNNSSMECYRRENNQIVLDPDFLKLDHNLGELDGIDESRNASRDNDKSEQNDSAINNVQEQGENSDAKVINNFRNLLDKVNKDKKNCAVFIKDMEWFVNLYASNNDKQLERIKMIQKLIKNKFIILVFSVSDIELLKKFGFDFENKNTIFVGHPTAQEIKLSYLRQFMQGTELNLIPINIMSELNKISNAIVASKKNLRSAMRVFKTIVKDRPHYEINYNDFKIAFEKQIDEDISLDDVILDAKTKNSIIEAVDTFLNASTEDRNSGNAKKGLVFSGHPGTGKTFFTKVLAKEKDCYFMAPSLSDLKGEFVGQTSGKVKRIFDEARASQPTIMFIDEADTIFPSRNLAGSGTSDSFNLDMVNQFLVEIDGAKSGNQKIFIIAATNRVSVLDNAIRSRLGQDIPFELPDKETRLALFDKKLEKDKIRLTGKSFSDTIASKTDNMSGRDIDNFVKSLRDTSRIIFKNELSSLNNDQLEKLFFEVLKGRERALINELKNIGVSIDIRSPKDNTLKGFSDIIGYDDIKETINRQVKYLKLSSGQKEKAKEYGIKPSKGILLYGPPGNGKSMLAAAAAKEHNFYFAKVLSKDFASINPDETLKNLRTIFSEIFKLSKMCMDVDGIVLFFDEYDSLASKMQLSSTVRGTLLDYMADNDKEGLRDPKGNILFMAATNFYEILDEALIRSGRIDEHKLMDNPTQENAIEMLKIFCKKKNKLVIEDSLYGVIYEKLHNQNIIKKQEDFKKNPEQLEKIIIGKNIVNITQGLSSTNISNANTEVGENIISNLARPSGADLENIVEKLLNQAFYTNSFKDDLLLISEKVINETFGDI